MICGLESLPNGKWEIHLGTTREECTVPSRRLGVIYLLDPEEHVNFNESTKPSGWMRSHYCNVYRLNDISISAWLCVGSLHNDSGWRNQCIESELMNKLLKPIWQSFDSLIPRHLTLNFVGEVTSHYTIPSHTPVCWIFFFFWLIFPPLKSCFYSYSLIWRLWISLGP